MKAAIAFALLALVSCAPTTPPPAAPVASESPPAAEKQGKPEKQGAQAKPEKTEAPPESDPLLALNQVARASYRAGKERISAQRGPTVIFEGDKLVYLRDGRRDEQDVHPRPYHDIKTVAHIPLALEGLVGDADGPLDEARVGGLKRLRERIDPALRTLESRGYPAATIERQKLIVSLSNTLIDGAIERKAIRHTDYAQFAKSVGSLLLANANDAARLEIDAMHQQMLRWKAATAPQEWSRLRVVVIGSHMARDQASQMQYFQRLLNEPVEGNRVVFAEGLWEESKALDLEATHILDARVGSSFFGESMRMHRDMMADAAAAYLRTLLPAGR